MDNLRNENPAWIVIAELVDESFLAYLSNAGNVDGAIVDLRE